MSKKIFLIEIIHNFQRYSFLVILPLMMRKTFILNPTIQYIFDARRFDVPLTNLWKLQKFEKSIYWSVSFMNRGDLILIRLILLSLYIDFHFV